MQGIRYIKRNISEYVFLLVVLIVFLGSGLFANVTQAQAASSTYEQRDYYFQTPFEQRLERARQGDVVAQFNVGLLYYLAANGVLVLEEGQDVAGAREQSAYWFDLAARAGSVDAMAMLCDDPQWKAVLIQRANGDDIQAIRLLMSRGSLCPVTQADNELLGEAHTVVLRRWHESALSTSLLAAERGSIMAMRGCN